MSRAWRIQYAGAGYHVMNRGVDGRELFLDRADYQQFEALLEQTVARFGLELAAYVLMSTHYHLVARTPEPNLSSAMAWLQGTYVSRFNRRHRRKGLLFQGRYKAILVEGAAYFTKLSAYVHWNPVRARMVDSPLRYRWSSYREYLRRRREQPWIRRELVPGNFGRRFEEQRERYRKWLYSVQGKERSFLDELRHGYLLGSDRFAGWVRRKFGEAPPREQPVKRRVRDEKVIERVLAAVAEEYGVRPERLCGDLRRGRTKEERQVAIYVLWSSTGVGATRIGRAFGVKHAAASNAARNLERQLPSNRRLRQKVARIRRHALDRD